MKFEVFCVKGKHFSKNWQIFLIWQIQFGKTRLPQPHVVGKRLPNEFAHAFGGGFST